MKHLIMPVALIASLIVSGTAGAEILCVKDHSASLRSSPSLTGSIEVLQVPLHYPLQVQAENGDFLQVRDYRGREGWVAKAAVRQGAGVIVNARVVNLRSGPGKNHAVTFKARQGVTFSVLEDQNGWLYVAHESGRKGWIYSALVWGLPSQLQAATL